MFKIPQLKYHLNHPNCNNFLQQKRLQRPNSHEPGKLHKKRDSPPNKKMAGNKNYSKTSIILYMKGIYLQMYVKGLHMLYIFLPPYILFIPQFFGTQRTLFNRWC